MFREVDSIPPYFHPLFTLLCLTMAQTQEAWAQTSVASFGPDCALCDEVQSGGEIYHHFHTNFICSSPPEPWCYDCDSRAGCHEDWEFFSGTCDDWHFHCMSSGEELIGLALEALDGHRIGDLDTLALAHPEVFVYNEVRQAYQILDCGGRVVGHFPLADEQWRARAVID